MLFVCHWWLTNKGSKTINLNSTVPAHPWWGICNQTSATLQQNLKGLLWEMSFTYGIKPHQGSVKHNSSVTAGEILKADCWKLSGEISIYKLAYTLPLAAWEITYWTRWILGLMAHSYALPWHNGTHNITNPERWWDKHKQVFRLPAHQYPNTITITAQNILVFSYSEHLSCVAFYFSTSLFPLPTPLKKSGSNNAISCSAPRSLRLKKRKPSQKPRT